MDETLIFRETLGRPLPINTLAPLEGWRWARTGLGLWSEGNEMEYSGVEAAGTPEGKSSPQGIQWVSMLENRNGIWHLDQKGAAEPTTMRWNGFPLGSFQLKLSHWGCCRFPLLGKEFICSCNCLCPVSHYQQPPFRPDQLSPVYHLLGAPCCISQLLVKPSSAASKFASNFWVLILTRKFFSSQNFLSRLQY